jgi:hypothetical protein
LVEEGGHSGNDARLVLTENGHHVVFLFPGIGNLIFLVDPQHSFRPVSSPMRESASVMVSMEICDPEKSMIRKIEKRPLRQLSSTSMIFPFSSNTLAVILETRPGESSPMAERLMIFPFSPMSHSLSEEGFLS